MLSYRFFYQKNIQYLVNENLATAWRHILAYGASHRSRKNQFLAA